jgi:hypothetical protein
MYWGINLFCQQCQTISNGVLTQIEPIFKTFYEVGEFDILG